MFYLDFLIVCQQVWFFKINFLISVCVGKIITAWKASTYKYLILQSVFWLRDLLYEFPEKYEFCIIMSQEERLNTMFHV